MVELQGVHNPNSKLSWGSGNYTVRETILHQKTSEGRQVFILVRNNWGSDCWQANFAL